MKFRHFLAAAAAGLFLISGTASAQVSYEQVRNATGKVTYNDTTFLIDPMLAEKGRYEGFAGSFNSEVRNPMVELPESKEQVMDGVDAVILTHTHLDHWDEVAQQFISKDIPFYVQDEADAAAVRGAGFTNVTVLTDTAEFGGVTLKNIEGTHGSQEMYDNEVLAAALGESMGVVFSAPGEKTVYLMGDTVWTPRVTKTLREFKPEIMIMNTGYARTLGYDGSIIMGIADVAKAAAFLPESRIVAVHMDAINHCMLSRKNLREYTRISKLTDRVIIPEDGEKVNL